MTDQAIDKPREKKRERPLDPVREAKAVAALRESLVQLGAGDDETLLLDSIEGETSLFEVIDALLLQMAHDRGLMAGIDAAVSDLRTRQERFEKRVDTNRALIEQAMMIAEVEKLERPAATLSLARRPASVEISEEADVPAQFWVSPPPKLDKKAVLAALKEGQAVPGACLSNAAPTLTVRTK